MHTLVAALGNDGDGMKAHNLPPNAKLVTADSSTPRVLLLEDHERTSEALRTLLERKAYRVTSASRVAEAMDILEAPDAPRLALLDWMLPDGTGLDVIRALRAAGDERYVYCIVVTSRDGEE